MYYTFAVSNATLEPSSSCLFTSSFSSSIALVLNLTSAFIIRLLIESILIWVLFTTLRIFGISVSSQMFRKLRLSRIIVPRACPNLALLILHFSNSKIVERSIDDKKVIPSLILDSIFQNTNADASAFKHQSVSLFDNLYTSCRILE